MRQQRRDGKNKRTSSAVYVGWEGEPARPRPMHCIQLLAHRRDRLKEAWWHQFMKTSECGPWRTRIQTTQVVTGTGMRLRPSGSLADHAQAPRLRFISLVSFRVYGGRQHRHSRRPKRLRADNDSLVTRALWKGIE